MQGDWYSQLPAWESPSNAQAVPSASCPATCHASSGCGFWRSTWCGTVYRWRVVILEHVGVDAVGDTRIILSAAVLPSCSAVTTIFARAVITFGWCLPTSTCVTAVHVGFSFRPHVIHALRAVWCAFARASAL